MCVIEILTLLTKNDITATNGHYLPSYLKLDHDKILAKQSEHQLDPWILSIILFKIKSGREDSQSWMGMFLVITKIRLFSTCCSNSYYRQSCI